MGTLLISKIREEYPDRKFYINLIISTIILIYIGIMMTFSVLPSPIVSLLLLNHTMQHFLSINLSKIQMKHIVSIMKLCIIFASVH